MGLNEEALEEIVEGRPELGMKVTRAGERALMSHFGGAVWLTHMRHQGSNSIDILNFGPDTGHKTGPSSGPHSVLGLSEFILGPKLLLVMGCVKLVEKNCAQLPSVGEQNAN